MAAEMYNSILFDQDTRIEVNLERTGMYLATRYIVLSDTCVCVYVCIKKYKKLICIFFTCNICTFICDTHTHTHTHKILLCDTITKQLFNIK